MAKTSQLRPLDYLRKSCLQLTGLSGLTWMKLVNRPKADETIIVENSKYENELGFDVFSALYDVEPKLKENPPDLQRAQLMQHMLSMSTFQEVREKSNGNEIISEVLTPHFYDELQKLKPPEETKEDDKAGQKKAAKQWWVIKQRLTKAAVQARQAMNAAEQFCKLVGWGSEKSPVVMRQFLNLPNLDKIHEKITQIH